MARGALILAVLIVGVTALVAQSWHKTMASLDQRIQDLGVADVSLRSRLVVMSADDVADLVSQRQRMRASPTWRVPTL